MFLNLPAGRNKRLSSDFGLPRSKSFLSTLNNSLSNNQQRSYSTASLKEQFKQFKNKSLSYGSVSHGHSVSLMQQEKQQTPGKKPLLDRGSYINNVLPSTQFGTSSGMKVNDFKKTYLNLDSKLSKTTKKEKDYFKQQAPQLNYQRYPTPVPPQPPMYKKQPSCYGQSFPSTYLQVQKKLQQQNNRRQGVLIKEMKQLKELNELLRIQNEELKKQRTIDLDLIARQNEIMQKQEELIEANQQAIYINKLNSPSRKNQNMSDSRMFSGLVNNVTPTIVAPCEQCKKRNQQSVTESQSKKVELQFVTLKVQKMEEEKKLLKNQLHELVYQSEKLKQQLKIAEEKYQKEVEHNQKLLQIIQNKQEKEPEKNKDQQQNQNDQKQGSINRQPYLNLLSNYEIQDLDEPVSIKKDRTKNQPKQMQQQQSELSSPTMRNLNVNENYKNSINIIKVSNRDEYNEIQRRLNRNDNEMERRLNRNDNENDENRNINYEKEKAKYKESQLYLQKLEREKQRQRAKVLEISKQRQTLLKRQIQRRKQKNHEWCQNENIRKYLNEINRQKIKQIDQIESLLRNE